MKIALIIEHFDATRGGAEHLAVWLANELARRGHEVHVVCHDVTSRINRYRQATLRASHDADASFRAHPPAPPAETPHRGLHVHPLRGMRVNTAIGLRRFGMRARQWCATHRPDVVHSLTVAFAGDIYHAYPGVFAAMQQQAAASRPTTATATLKRMMLRIPGKQRTLAALERRAVLGTGGARGQTFAARRIISLCGMMTRQFSTQYGVPPERIVELATPWMDFNGTRDLDPAEAARLRRWFRGNYRLGEKDRVAIFVGHDFRRKGLRQAIETIAHTRTGWKLLIVGLGKAREFVEFADALGIGDAAAGDGRAPGKAGERRILFVGPTREMAGVYAAADALLLPTFYDPSGLVVQEAFGYGLPVVSTEFLGASDLVKAHNAGTIVKSPRDTADMAAALDKLPLAQSPEQHALAERARAASRGISPEAYIQALLKLYTEVKAA